MPVESIRPVLVCLDASPASLDALDLAARESTMRSAPLVVVLAEQADGAEAMDAVLGRVRTGHPGSPISVELVCGDPAEALVARSHARPSWCLATEVVADPLVHVSGQSPIGRSAVPDRH